MRLSMSTAGMAYSAGQRRLQAGKTTPMKVTTPKGKPRPDLVLGNKNNPMTAALPASSLLVE
jgi:hypothetical protein